MSSERTMERIVVVDDEPFVVEVMTRSLTLAGYEAVGLSNPEDLLSKLESEAEIAVVVTDILMPSMDGVTFCGKIKELRPDVEVIAMTGAGSVEVAVAAMKAGAYDFLTKPFDHDDVVTQSVAKALERRRLLRRTQFLEHQLDLSDRFQDIIGKSPQMMKVFQMIETVAPTDATVLLQGESGTGKELVARALHERSTRSGQPFVTVNCSAFSESLLESELFGHTRGAFTGATQARKGLFEAAEGGTLFLDELAEMAPSTQVSLLRVLQNGEVRPVGSDQTHQVDVRIVAATNSDLALLVKEGSFREDLFYRINVITVLLPPLRERLDDMAELIQWLLNKNNEKTKKQIAGVTSDARELLLGYSWPGNIRELENVIERAVILSSSPTLDVEDLPLALVEEVKSMPKGSKDPFVLPLTEAKRDMAEEFERRYLEQALTRAGGVVNQAARESHVDPSNFRRLIAKYKLDPDHYRSS